MPFCLSLFALLTVKHLLFCVNFRVAVALALDDGSSKPLEYSFGCKMSKRLGVRSYTSTVRYCKIRISQEVDELDGRTVSSADFK